MAVKLDRISIPVLTRWAADAMTTIIEQYRSGERDDFAKLYREKWLPRFQAPDVAVKPNFVPF
jgi:hypothetical protein